MNSNGDETQLNAGEEISITTDGSEYHQPLI